MEIKWYLVVLAVVGFSIVSCARATDTPAAPVRSESGAFSLVPIPGYTLAQTVSGMTLYPDPFDPASGPGMVLGTTTLEAAVDLDQAAAVARKRYSAYLFSDPVQVEIGGITGVQLDFTTEYHADDGVVLDYYGADEGEIINGRLILVLLDPQTLFEARMLAPQSQWKKVLPLYQEVIKRIGFAPVD